MNTTIETIENVTVRHTFGIHSLTGERRRGRSWGPRWLFDLPTAEARALIDQGLAREAPPIVDVSSGELKRGRAAAESVAARLEKSEAGLAECRRRERDLDAKPECPPEQIERVWTDIRLAERDVRLAQDAKAKADAALADLEKREAMTEARRELAAAAARRKVSEELAANVVDQVVRLRAAVTELFEHERDGNHLELRRAIQCEVLAVLSSRPAELRWIFE